MKKKCRIKRMMLSLMAATALLYMPANAHARNSAVQVDMSVLQEVSDYADSYGGYYGYQGYEGPPSLYPAQRQQQPVLTAPGRNAYEAYQYAPSRPFAAEAYPQGQSVPYPAPAQALQKAAPVMMPITGPVSSGAERETRETGYPVVDMVVPARKPVTDTKATASPNHIRQAAQSSTKESDIREAQADPPPTPERRPAIQKASSSFVQQARADILKRITPDDFGESNRIYAKPLKSAEAAMPAVPSGRVYAEPLNAPAMSRKPSAQPREGDTLMARLVEPDKYTLAETIESIHNPSGRVPSRSIKAEGSERMADKIALDESPLTPDPPASIFEEVPPPLPGKKPEFELASLVDLTVEPAAGTPKPYRREEIPDITATGKPSVKKAAMSGNVPRPPRTRGFEEEYISMPYENGEDSLGAEMTGVLQEKIVPLLQEHPGWRLQIQSFASPVDHGASSARRVSLARALSIRSFLLDQGIEAQRMDIRALGMQTDRDPVDRIDLVFFDPAEVN